MKTSKTEIKVCRVNSTRCEWRNVETNTHLYWPCSVFDAGVYNRMRMYWNTWFGDKFAWNSNSRTLRMPSSLSINCDFFTSYTKHTETSRKKPFRVRYKAACTFIYIRMRLIPCRIFIQCLLASHSIQRMDSLHFQNHVNVSSWIFITIEHNQAVYLAPLQQFNSIWLSRGKNFVRSI